MAGRSPRVAAVLAALSLLPIPAAHAAEPTPGASAGTPAPTTPAGPAAPKAGDDAKAEAARRFDRGLKLFNAGDNAGALAEFKRIYEIVPNPVVLYNIGLVYAAMARPVDAVDALESAIKSGVLSASDLERATATLNDQAARVARLNVTTVPEQAAIEVDGVQVAKTPLLSPIRIAEGNHIVGAAAEGYTPARKEIVVAGNVDASLHLELVRSRGKGVGNLSVRTATLGAEVHVNGKPMGRTPLATSLTLPMGNHEVELRRPGYVSERRQISLGEGATGEVALDLRVDPQALGRDGATLLIESSESPFEVTVDGERRGVYGASLRLPRGPHDVTVTAAGFVPGERVVTLEPSVTNVARFVLEPTPETRERHRSNALFHRYWGIGGIIGGAVLGGVGTALVVVGSGQKKDGEDGIAEVERKLEADEPPCDQFSGFAAEPDQTQMQCDQARADAQSKVDAGRTKSIAGFVGIGVGGAVAVTGLVLLLTGDDPDQYEHPRAGLPGARFALRTGPGEIGASLSASF